MKNTVLDKLEQNNCNPSYNCRNGYCGMCSVKLIEGKVETIGNPIGFVPKGNILACASVMVSEKIKLSIDDKELELAM